MKKKIVLTGSSGFIGKNLSFFLKKKGIKLRSIQTKKILKKKFNFRNISYFIHSGFEINKNKIIIKEQVRILNKIIEYAKKYKFRIVFFSSSSIGKKRELLLHNNYQKAKYKCEKILFNEKREINYLVLRIFNVYGPGQSKEKLVPSIINSLVNRKKEFIKIYYPDDKRDFIFIDDLSNAVFKILNKKKINNEILEIGSVKIISIFNLFTLLKKLTKKKNIQLIKKKPLSSIIPKTRALIIKNKKKFNWQPKTSLYAGISITKKFYEKKNTFSNS